MPVAERFVDGRSPFAPVRQTRAACHWLRLDGRASAIALLASQEREKNLRLVCRDLEELVSRINATRGKKRMNCALSCEWVFDFGSASNHVRMRWAPSVALVSFM